MTNAQATSVPYVGRGSRSMPTTDVPARPGVRSGHGRRNLVLALIVGAVVIAGIAGAWFARSSGEATAVVPSSALANAMQVRDAYAAGGSVYAAQVPAAATVESGLTAYLPGGSVYAAQVPAAATTTLTEYLPGGSVYAAQVPAAATTTLTEYLPGGSVYNSQVPQH